MKYPVVIFDLDGTLADTSFGIIHSLKAMEKELGLAGLPQETLRKFVGPVFSEALKEYYHVTQEQVPRMIEVFRKNYAQQGYKQTKPYPGIHRLLKEIKKLGGKIGVATVKNARMTELTLQELGLWDEFDYIASNHGEHIDKKTLILQVLQALAWPWGRSTRGSSPPRIQSTVREYIPFIKDIPPDAWIFTGILM